MTPPKKAPQIVHGDCLEIMKMLPDNSVDSIVTDPPYGLGFMGKAWDALPPGLEWAAECLRVLKPGGHLLAFGGTRTWHRLALSIEDAGFEIRDSIAWMYGSGFPKHRAALKPAFEPIVMARKPFKGSLTANESTHGTGALNIDGCRIESDPATFGLGGGSKVGSGSGDNQDPSAYRTNGKVMPMAPGGRWPANIVLDENMAEELDRQSGISSTRPAKAALSGEGSGSGKAHNASSYASNAVASIGYEDAGGASRFFYVAKAPKKERPNVDGMAHPTVKPLALMRWLVKLVTPEGGTVLEPFAGSGATVEACILEGFHCIAIEREAEYLPLIQARINRQAA